MSEWVGKFVVLEEHETEMCGEEKREICLCGRHSGTHIRSSAIEIQPYLLKTRLSKYLQNHIIRTTSFHPPPRAT